MAYTTLSLGLTLTIPTNGTRNWGTTLLNTTWTKISQHSHTGSGDGNLLTGASFAANSITTDKIAKNFNFTIETLSPLASAQTLNWNNGNVKILDLAAAIGNVTLTLTNPIAGSLYKVIVKNGPSFHDLLWPASVKWAQGQAPILTQTANAIDLVELWYDGTNYYGDWNVDYQ